MSKVIANPTTAQMMRKWYIKNETALSTFLGIKISNKTLRT